MKKIPFDYEYFKLRPDTKLVTRDDRKVTFVGIAPDLTLHYPVVVFIKGHRSTSVISLEGKQLSGKHAVDADVFMLVEPKIEKYYRNEYFSYASHLFESVKAAIDGNTTVSAHSVTELTVTDGKVTDVKTIHRYV